MGASTFHSTGEGATVREAFLAAYEQAVWEHGHGGYSGTIAEKHEYVEVIPPEGVSAEEFAAALYAADDTWTPEHGVIKSPPPSWAPSDWDEIRLAYDDKWGPAVAIKSSPTTWLFVGWASC